MRFQNCLRQQLTPFVFLYKQAVIAEYDDDDEDDENEIPFSTKNYPLVAQACR